MNDLERKELEIRKSLLEMFLECGSGHIGGSLSILKLLTVLYFKHMKFDPTNPVLDTRDYFILSKGHCGPALYATLANFGFFDKALLKTLNQNGTHLPSHCNRLLTPGVDMTAGSLGQGIGVAAGIAYGLKLEKRSQYVFCVLGDGELNEGSCWEAFQFIAHHRLDKLIIFIDANKRQLDGLTKDILNPYDLSLKMQSFGFETLAINGDDLEEIDAAICHLKEIDDVAKCIILNTTKGQGVPFVENAKSNHHMAFKRGSEEYILLSKEIDLLHEKLKEERQ